MSSIRSRAFLILLHSPIGFLQTRKPAVPWTRLISALQCISSKQPCLDSSLSFQPAYLLAFMIRLPEGLTLLRPIRRVAACSRALPQVASPWALFNPSTRVDCKLSLLVEDPRQVSLRGLPQHRDRARSTNPPPLALHPPHSGTSPPRRRPTPISTLMALTRQRKVTSKPMQRSLS